MIEKPKKKKKKGINREEQKRRQETRNFNKFLQARKWLEG